MKEKKIDPSYLTILSKLTHTAPTEWYEINRYEHGPLSGGPPEYYYLHPRMGVVYLRREEGYFILETEKGFFYKVKEQSELTHLAAACEWA